MTGPLYLRTRSADETRRIGAALAEVVGPGEVVLLCGHLGAGKTTLVQGLVRALGSQESVTSPTFTLLRTYATDPPIAHVDCWRLEEPAQLVDLALEEDLDEGAVAVIEWGELAESIYGEESLRLELSAPDADSREITISATGEQAQPRLARFAASLRAAGLACERGP